MATTDPRSHGRPAADPVPAGRIERDSMGPVRIAAGARWGASTQRAVENFPISGWAVDPEVLAALAEIKRAAALANAALGVLDRERATVIAAVAAEIAEGAESDQFPVDVFQTGSGTSTNMNMNEVVAHLATGRLAAEVHPNDHVNASQSSNDVFPSAVHIACARVLTDELLPAIERLADALAGKGDEMATVVKAGRTHLMDAAPVTLGQELHGYASQLRASGRRVAADLPALLELPLGGTAVGTGLNVPDGFVDLVIASLRERTGLALVEAPDHFAAQGARDALVGTSGDLRAVAVALYKIANDVRWMGSGPTAGLGELVLPTVQPGSSIMPGKVNPVLCEAVLQVVAQVIGCDATVAFAGSQGNFELNTFMPVMARNVLEPIRLLAASMTVFTERCVQGLTADVETCARHASTSPALATALTTLVGYDRATEIVHQALREGSSIRDVAVASGVLDAPAADDLLDPLRLATS